MTLRILLTLALLFQPQSLRVGPSKRVGPTLRTQTAGGIALVAHGLNAGPLNTTGASLLVAVCMSAGAPALPADSQANTWNAGTLFQNTNQGFFLRTYYVFNPTTNAAQTYTNNCGSCGVLFVSAWSGTLTTASVFDATAENGSNSGAGSATSAQPGSITPSQTGELLISGLMIGSSDAGRAITNGFAIQDSSNSCGLFYDTAYLVDSTSSAINPTWSWTTTAANVVNIEGFKH